MNNQDTSKASETVTLTLDGKAVEYTRSDLAKKNSGGSVKDENGNPYVIARCTSAGVHAGYLIDRDSDGYVIISNARRIWSWDGAGSLSELAVYGSSKPSNCKFGAQVETQELLKIDVCELIHCQAEGFDMISSQVEWRA